MKRIFTIAISIPAVLLFAFLLSILLLAATGRGETQTNQIALRLEKLERNITMEGIQTNEYVFSVSHMKKTGVVTEVVKSLAASGEICKVFGHWYPNVWIGERKCKFCGKVEPNLRIK